MYLLEFIRKLYRRTGRALIVFRIPETIRTRKTHRARERRRWLDTVTHWTDLAILPGPLSQDIRTHMVFFGPYSSRQNASAHRGESIEISPARKASISPWETSHAKRSSHLVACPFPSPSLLTARIRLSLCPTRTMASKIVAYAGSGTQPWQQGQGSNFINTHIQLRLTSRP